MNLIEINLYKRSLRDRMSYIVYEIIQKYIIIRRRLFIKQQQNRYDALSLLECGLEDVIQTAGREYIQRFIFKSGTKRLIYSLMSYNLKQQNSNMQKSLHHLTPQKRTLNKFSFHDEHLLKELSPQLLTVGSSGYGKVHLEMLNSPLPTNKDLFSQLLQSQFKMNYEEYYQNYEILEEDSYEIIDELNPKEQVSEQDSEMIEDNDQQEDENGIKKRKRKSTAQIKILKQELEVEPNWSKQKIAEMSDITGLSQSQVYKWWWDQKKKNMKQQRENSMKLLGKRRLIKKDFTKKTSQSQNDNQSDSEEEAFTKPKIVIDIVEVPQTEKKVNKRLTFA